MNKLLMSDDGECSHHCGRTLWQKVSKLLFVQLNLIGWKDVKSLRHTCRLRQDTALHVILRIIELHNIINKRCYSKLISFNTSDTRRPPQLPLLNFTHYHLVLTTFRITQTTLKYSKINQDMYSVIYRGENIRTLEYCDIMFCDTVSIFKNTSSYIKDSWQWFIFCWV